MKIMFADKSEMDVSRVRVTSGEETLTQLRAIISIDKSLASTMTVEKLRNKFTLANIATIVFKSKGGDETMQFTAVQDITYIMNDYENNFDVTLEYRTAPAVV